MEDDTTISIRLSEHEPGTATRRQTRALVDLLTEKLGAQGNGSWAAEGIRLDIRGTMATAFFLDELLAGAGRLACEPGIDAGHHGQRPPLVGHRSNTSSAPVASGPGTIRPAGTP